MKSTKESTLQVNDIVKLKKPFTTNSGREYTSYFRIRTIRGTWCNLESPFGSRQCIMRYVPLTDVVECQKEWYAKWQQTDSYQCM